MMSQGEDRWRFNNENDINIKVSKVLGKYVTFTINKISNMGMMTPFCGSKEVLDLIPDIVVSLVPCI